MGGEWCVSSKAWRWARAEVRAFNDRKSDRHDPLPAADVAILLTLADRYNDEWSRAWPSQRSLGIDTGLSESTVRRATRSLEERGLIEIEEWRMNDGDERMPNRYLLPTYRPSIRPASVQPVLAFTRAEGDYSFDGMREVPGSNIGIDVDALD